VTLNRLLLFLCLSLFPCHPPYLDRPTLHSHVSGTWPSDPLLLHVPSYSECQLPPTPSTHSWGRARSDKAGAGADPEEGLHGPLGASYKCCKLMHSTGRV
jgi:hypothetical protein